MKGSNRMPRPGDQLAIEGQDRAYRVEAVDHRSKRLLVRDHDGDVFVIRSYRLQSGPWRLIPSLPARRQDRFSKVHAEPRHRRAA